MESVETETLSQETVEVPATEPANKNSFGPGAIFIIIAVFAVSFTVTLIFRRKK